MCCGTLNPRSRRVPYLVRVAPRRVLWSLGFGTPAAQIPGMICSVSTLSLRVLTASPNTRDTKGNVPCAISSSTRGELRFSPGPDPDHGIPGPRRPNRQDRCGLPAGAVGGRAAGDDRPRPLLRLHQRAARRLLSGRRARDRVVGHALPPRPPHRQRGRRAHPVRTRARPALEFAHRCHRRRPGNRGRGEGAQRLDLPRCHPAHARGAAVDDGLRPGIGRAVRRGRGGTALPGPDWL